MKSRVAVLRVAPDTIFSDIDRLVELAGVSQALAAGQTTILKDNISWHFPFPAANTTPWQLEGTIQALASRGFTDQVCVQNKTAVTNAFKSQQHRWAEGSVQTCRKLLPQILRANIPIGVKVEAFFHLTANFNYPLTCVLSVLMFPSMVIRYNMGWYEMLLIDVPLFFAATFSVCNFYMVCQREIHHDWRARARYLPFLMSIGIGLCINNTRAVFSALFNKPTEFARTPKYRIEGASDEWVGKKYRQSVAVQPLVELVLGLYFTATVFYALANQIYGTVPFLVLFQVGYLYTGLVSVVQQYAGGQVVLNTQVASGK